MSDRQEFIDSARRFSVQFAGLLKAADVLEELNSVENAAREAEQRRADAQAEHAKLIAYIKKDKAEHEQYLAEVDAQVAERLTASNDAVERTRKDCDQHIESAKAEAARIIEDGKVTAAALVEKVKQLTSGATSELANLNALVALRKAELVDVAAQTTAAQVKLEEANRNLAELRSRL